MKITFLFVNHFFNWRMSHNNTYRGGKGSVWRAREGRAANINPVGQGFWKHFAGGLEYVPVCQGKIIIVGLLPACPWICPQATRLRMRIHFWCPEAGFAKRSRTTSSIHRLTGWPASAHEGFGLRELLKVSHKDLLSPPQPGVKTRGTRHKKRVVCMSRQQANFVKAAVGEKSWKHPGKSSTVVVWAGDRR